MSISLFREQSSKPKPIILGNDVLLGWIQNCFVLLGIYYKTILEANSTEEKIIKIDLSKKVKQNAKSILVLTVTNC